MIVDRIYVLKKKKLMYGPYSLQTIIEKGLKETDMVWFEGLENWKPASEVEELSHYIKKASKLEVASSEKKTFLQKLFSFLN